MRVVRLALRGPPLTPPSLRPHVAVAMGEVDDSFFAKGESQ
jgi:hypothetical protein